MGVDKRSGGKHITKRPTGSDVPFTDQSPDQVNNLNVAQIATDVYSVPSLDGDGLPNLPVALETQINYRRLSRPSFRANPADFSQVVVPASAGSPAIVYINGVYYTNTSDHTMDIDTSGRDGLDTGAKAANKAYYLYAIPPTSGSTFDLVCSLNPPTSGPSGFANWSYLGAFATKDALTNIVPFRSINGVCLADDEIESESHTGNTTVTAKTFECLPVTAHHASGRLDSNGPNTNINHRAAGISTVGNVGLIVNSQVANIPVYISGFFAVFTAQTVYLSTGNAGNTVTFNLNGWIEKPTEYQ